MRTYPFVLSLLLPATLLLFHSVVAAQEVPAQFPHRVLITNDNGIDDPKIVALARAFSEHAETWVVAPVEDRSGSGAQLSMMRTGSLRVESRDLGPAIRAYAVDGYPADAVLVALAGLMADSLPDLVISGINGGANIGGEWLYSGTVGAARVAAYAGFPAIAVSGLVQDEVPGATESAVDWVLRFTSTEWVRDLTPPEYLTVSFPRSTPEGVRGVRVTDRAPLQVAPRITEAEEGVWRVVGIDSLAAVPESGSDVRAWEDGYISIVPMRIDEVDHEVVARWRPAARSFPEWRPERR